MSIFVFVTVKIQFDNTSTYKYSIYSPFARSLCPLARLGPPLKNTGSAPDTAWCYHHLKRGNQQRQLFKHFSGMLPKFEGFQALEKHFICFKYFQGVHAHTKPCHKESKANFPGRIFI